jgi:hypothetical protein
MATCSPIFWTCFTLLSAQLTMELYMAFYSRGTDGKNNNSISANSLTIRTTRRVTVREPLIPMHDEAASSVLIAMHSTNS